MLDRFKAQSSNHNRIAFEDPKQAGLPASPRSTKIARQTIKSDEMSGDFRKL